MTYVIVIEKDTVIGEPLTSHGAALDEAARRFGACVRNWMSLNLRVEENR